MEKKEISGKVKINNASFNGIVNAASVDLKSRIINNDNINACIAERGVAGFSPVANVIKNGDDVTITITDYKGTTTATIPDMSDEVERIESLIPNTASTTNKLVDSATLNSSVQTATSNFRGDWATYADIPTDASLYPVDAAGVRTPSTNDYLVVMTDEEKNGGTWRYKYVGLWSVDGKNGWQAEYQVNETPFTADQLAAINSGITSELVGEIGGGGGGLEIGDIGFTQMAIDESKGKRRALKRVDNIIIQEQYPELTKSIKATQALDPDLFCTEQEWQAELTASPNGVCYKYVIDDEAGTIRLPKYPEYFIAGLKGVAPVVGNGMVLGLMSAGVGYGLCSADAHILAGRTGVYGIQAGKTSSSGDWNPSGYSFSVTNDSTKSGIEAKLNTNQTEQIRGTYFIQVATGAETEDNIINEIELNNPFSLLDYKFSEYELNNLSWLRSEGQYNSKAIYPAVYDLLLKIYNGVETKAGVSVKSTDVMKAFKETGSTGYHWLISTETPRIGQSVYTTDGRNVGYITSITSTNGFTFLDISGTYFTAERNTGLDATIPYSDYDFVLNTAEETFRLPLKVKLAGGKAVVGNGMSLGLTDGSHYVGIGESGELGRLYVDSAFYNNKVGTRNANEGFDTTNDVSLGIVTDPTKSGIETSDNGLYLYFYVGETVQNANLINAGRIEEKISSLIPDNSSLISSYGMPSNKYINLTLGASGSVYTAPANGYFAFSTTATSSANNYTYLRNQTTNICFYAMANAQIVADGFVPAKKGDIVSLGYFSSIINTFIFVYAESEV